MKGAKPNPWLRLAKGKVFLHEGDCLSVMRKMKPDSAARYIQADDQRRFAHPFKARGAWNMSSAAIDRGRSVFWRGVVNPEDSPALLVSGTNNRKIGRRVTVGRWKGMPIYTLTLEERVTCPDTCHHWKSCYGNAMPFARRHKHGPVLEGLLETELHLMSLKHPKGFVVRLHILGDFYSVDYVEKWKGWLKQFPLLRVFGYTARWKADDPITGAVQALRRDHWDRFAIRSSLPLDVYAPFKSAVTIKPGDPLPGDMPGMGEHGYRAFLCPAQRRDDKCCATCGACWESDRTVAFIEHGRRNRKARG